VRERYTYPTEPSSSQLQTDQLIWEGGLEVFKDHLTFVLPSEV